MNNKKKNKPVYNVGGFLNFIQGASPLLNAVMPGLGVPVGAAAGIAASQIKPTPAPATYEPMTGNTNKYGMRKGGRYAMGGALQDLGANSLKVQANNPSANDSVELPSAFVDHNEVLSKLSDGTTYVFPDDKINPLTGNKYSKDAEKLAKATAKAEERINDPHAKNAIKHMDAQRNMYAATNEITNMLQEGIKQGLRYGGKLKMQRGGPYDPTQSDPYSNTLPTATVTAPRGANWLPEATVTDTIRRTNVDPIAQSIMQHTPRRYGPAQPNAGTRYEEFNYPIGVLNDVPYQPSQLERIKAAYPGGPSGYKPSNVNIDPMDYLAGDYSMPSDNTYVAPQYDRTNKLATSVTDVPTATSSPEFEPVPPVPTPAVTPRGGGGKNKAATPKEEFPDALPMRGRDTARMDEITLPGLSGVTSDQDPTGLEADLANKNLPRELLGNTPVTEGVAGQTAGQSPMNRIGEFFQLAELGAKAGLMARGYDRQQLHQNNAPINLRSYDPTTALQQSQYGYQAAQDQIRNTTSRASMMGNLQQASANQARQTSQIATQYQQLNNQAQSQYERELGARRSENIRNRYATDQIRQQDEAAYFNNLDTLLTSVGNYGREKVNQDYNQKAVELVLQAFPDIAKYFKV